jgi:hypothetical protein
MTKLQDTLNERGATYGSFTVNAHIAQHLKNLLHSHTSWDRFNATQKEALEVIASKLSRLLTGDPSHHDSWLDIAGYATLVANEIEANQPTNKLDPRDLEMDRGPEDDEDYIETDSDLDDESDDCYDEPSHITVACSGGEIYNDDFHSRDAAVACCENCSTMHIRLGKRQGQEIRIDLDEKCSRCGGSVDIIQGFIL